MIKACSLITFLSFFVHSAELIKLPNDILYVIFTDIQEEETLNQKNSSNFLKYLRLPMDINYYVCPSPLVYVNKFFTSFFQKNKLLLTKDYLEQNILDEIVWIQKKYDLFFPLEKLTCFFSDIQHGEKGTIQCTINNLASAYAEKYSKNNQLIWKNKYTEAKMAYKAIPHKFVDMTIGSLQEIISTTNTDIETTAQNIDGRKTELAKLDKISDYNFYYINEDVNDVLRQQENTFNIQKAKLVELEAAFQKASIFTTKIKNIVAIDDKDSFQSAFIKLKSKNLQIHFNVKNQKTSLLKLIAIQLFAPYYNSAIHKNIAFGYGDDTINDILGKNTSTIYLNKSIYRALWPDQENFKSKIFSYINTMVRLKDHTNLFFPYFLIEKDILELNFSQDNIFKYYNNIKKGPFNIKNISTINFTINSVDSFFAANKLLNNCALNIKINWKFLNPFFIQNEVLTINENFIMNYYANKLNNLHLVVYQSIMDTIKTVDITSNIFSHDNNKIAVLSSFIKNLLKNIKVQHSFLNEYIQNDTLNLDRKAYRNSFCEQLNSLYNNHPVVYHSITSTVKTVDITSDMFFHDDKIKATLSFFISNLPKTIQIKYDSLRQYIGNKLTIDQFFYIFIMPLLKEQNDSLLMHKDLLSLFTYIKKEKYASFLQHINTVICHASDTKELMEIMRYWHCAVHSKNVLDGKKLKIIVPSNIIKKNFKQSFYFSVLYKIICNAAYLEKQKIHHMPAALIYAVYMISLHGYFLINSIISDNYCMFLVQLLFSLEKGISTYYDQKCCPNEKLFLIDKLIQYIFVCMQLYTIVSQYNNQANKYLAAGIIACITLSDYYLNKSSLLFNLIKTKIQTTNKQSPILNDISIDVDLATTNTNT